MAKKIKKYNIKEAADYLGYTVGTLYQLIHRKQVAYYKRGKFIEFEKCDLDKFLQSRVSRSEVHLNNLVSSYKVS